MNVKDQCISERFAIYNGDCVDVLRGLPDASIDFSIFSPPFASLYCYSNSERDMGNSRTYEEFWKHYSFLIAEQFRTMKSGRLVSIHCMDLPTSKQFHGYIGLRDFRGDIIRAYEAAGFIYHSSVVIWKDPLVAMQRTKALGLLHKQIVKDSSMCRQGVPDFLVTLRKPGVNEEPITHAPAGFTRWVGEAESEPKVDRTNSPQTNKYSHEVWQAYASPVWMDINPSDTLQRESAREDADERHIAPLQLQVIERALELWSNPDDLVCSPFAGIGSEGYVALRCGRRFVGAELKGSYYQQAVRNLTQVEYSAGIQMSLVTAEATDAA